MYIDSKDLAPLDVLLFGGSGKGSKVIRYATASTYSHAGIVTAENTIFEAVPGGLSHRPYTASLVSEPSIFVSGEGLAMLRHPVIPLFSDNRHKSLLAEAEVTLRRLEGKRYSSFESFAALGSQPWMRFIDGNFPNCLRLFLHGLSEVHEWTSSIRDRSDFSLKYLESQLRDDELGKRLYCSETIEFILEELGLPVRRAAAGCNGLTPGDLANRNKTLLLSVASVMPGSPRIQKYGNSTLVEEVLKDCDNAAEAATELFEARKRIPAPERIEAITQREALGPEFWSLKMFADSVQSSASRMMRFLHNLIDLHRLAVQRSAPFWSEWTEAATAFLSREKELIPTTSTWDELTRKTTHTGALRLIENLKSISVHTLDFQKQAHRLLAKPIE
jgi:hypothetical protein